MKRTGPSNPVILELLDKIRTVSSKNKSKFWKRICYDLLKPARNRRFVNIFKINSLSSDNETIIVPGKVLGTGDINKKLTIAALSFSQSAIEKINKSGSKALSIGELLEKNPEGKNVRIVG